MTEDEFYKKKIFSKVGINELKTQYPDNKTDIDTWYQSERYKFIQERKSFLSGKLKKQLLEEGETYNFSDDELFRLFQWWECTPKICKYCSLPENLLDDLHNQEGHINKRYPQRGKSLEIDRMQSDLPYTVIENLVLACYWCNNAKTDTFTGEEFIKIGEKIKTIWENRLNRKL